jgi:preprotein translocase YajC subunit
MLAATLSILFAAAKAKKSSSFGPDIIILYLVVFGGLYFFYLRPRRAKQAAARQTVRKVEVGDQAQTIGGFVGTVVKMDDLVTLRGPGGAELDFIPSAIARKYEPPVHEPDVPESTDDDHEAQEGDK